MIDREEATRDSDFQLDDDDDDVDDEETWEGEGEWNNDGEEVEGDVKDESAAYLEFLNEEVRTATKNSLTTDKSNQAQKFGAVGDADDDDLEEESMLETPLDKVEPYSVFKNTLMSTLFLLLRCNTPLADNLLKSCNEINLNSTTA